MAFNPQPKPEKDEPIKMTAYEFRKKYGNKLEKRNRTPKKGKGSEYSKLVKLLDDWFSRYVRLNASNNEGMAHCVSCNTYKQVKYMDCGHYFSRNKKSTRWDLQNVDIQCKGCNSSMGNPTINNSFRTALIDRGVALEELEVKKNLTYKPEKFTLEFEIEKYKKLVSELLEEKGLIKWW
jgi:5-methylcytosine-specific restriction endonuclease McrA